jgi:hypothetical protein
LRETRNAYATNLLRKVLETAEKKGWIDFDMEREGMRRLKMEWQMIDGDGLPHNPVRNGRLQKPSQDTGAVILTGTSQDDVSEGIASSQHLKLDGKKDFLRLERMREARLKGMNKALNARTRVTQGNVTGPGRPEPEEKNPRAVQLEDPSSPMGTVVSRGMDLWNDPLLQDAIPLTMNLQSINDTGGNDVIPLDIDSSDSDESLQILSPESYHKEIIKAKSKRSDRSSPSHSPTTTPRRTSGTGVDSIPLQPSRIQLTHPLPTQQTPLSSSEVRLQVLKRQIELAKAQSKTSQTNYPLLTTSASIHSLPTKTEEYATRAGHPRPTRRMSPGLAIPAENDHWARLNYQKRSEKLDFEILDKLF